MKSGTRVLGIDDAAFSFEDEETFLTGVVYRGTEFVEDIVTASVEVDGLDATGKVIELYGKCQNPTQIKAILVDGISLAGFNLVDLEEAAEETGVPVIAVTSNMPRKEEFREAMERTGNFDEVFESLGEAEEVELKDGTSYIQYAGTSFREAEQVIKRSTIHGLTPEPVRVAHLIGRAFRGT